MKIKVTTGKYDLIDSGFVVAEGAKPVRFTIEDIFIEMKFLDDEHDERMETDISSDGQGLNLRLYNFCNPFGTGFHDMRNIATINGSRVFFSFSASYTELNDGKKFRHVKYSFYKEDNVDDK